MPRAWLLPLCLLTAVACTSQPALVAPSGPTPADTSAWPAPDAALARAAAAMGQLRSLHERFTSTTYRNGDMFLSYDVERAYVAPDRRYERVEGRSPVETVKGETVTIGDKFYKRVADNATWQVLPPMEGFAWPSNSFTFTGVQATAWGGADPVDGRPARLLLLSHTGNAAERNEGWQFQTRLWIDPETNYYLKRQTRGTRDDQPDDVTGKPMAQRYEATWTYTNHNDSISISEPAVAEGQ